MKRRNIERIIGLVIAAAATPFLDYGSPWSEVAAAFVGIGGVIAGIGQGRKLEDR